MVRGQHPAAWLEGWSEPEAVGPTRGTPTKSLRQSKYYLLQTRTEDLWLRYIGAGTWMLS